MRVHGRQRPVEKVRSGLDRVIRKWTDATELVRQAAAEPSYAGPSVEEMEAVGEAIAQMREKLRGWVWATAANEARGLRPLDHAAVRAVIKGLSGRG